MKKIAMSLATIAAVMMLTVGATSAWLSDPETSNGNTFSAGTLDLNLDGGNTNIVKFNIGNMVPGNQPKGHWNLKNVGSINGYIDIENVVLTGFENNCIEPETQAGDSTCGASEGELQNVLNVRMFVDTNKDGWISTGENVFYNGLAKDMPTHFELNQPLAAGADFNIEAIVDWWSTASDNLAQGDTMTLDMTFELGQTTAQ